jgi:acyl phosphate:glycerol-3-phosphate acyltransferase
LTSLRPDYIIQVMVDFTIFLPVIAFFVGAFPFGVITKRLMAFLKPDQYMYNRQQAKARLLVSPWIIAFGTGLDLIKMYLIVIIARSFADQTFVLICATSAFIGDCFSPFLRFRGSKGIAASIGAFIGFDPALAGIMAGIYIIIFLFLQYPRMAFMLEIAIFPFVLMFMGQDITVVGFSLIVLLIVGFKHAGEIRNFLEGTTE